ncbi:MAG TPA: aspartyl protease family protein [Blastocatellia bacterium]|jgi:hypothetical protein
MSHQLTFEQLVNYDPGQPGISVDVTLGLNGDQVSCEAKIDTGSTFCLFARKVGEDLGVDVENGIRRMVGTVTGNFAVYLHEVNLSLAGCSFIALVGFAEDEAFQRNVLGRRGFLEQVILGLVDYEGKLYLGSHNE